VIDYRWLIWLGVASLGPVARLADLEAGASRWVSPGTRCTPCAALSKVRGSAEWVTLRATAPPPQEETIMGFWLDLISGRRYASPYEPLRHVPADELAEFGHDGDEGGRDERASGDKECPNASIEAGSAA
jgi:hypothetical protein